MVVLFFPFYRRLQKKSSSVLVLLVSFCILWCKRCNELPMDFLNFYAQLSKLEKSDSGCKLPNLDPWDTSIIKYVIDMPPLNCKHLQPALTFIDAYGMLKFNQTELEQFGGKGHSLQCKFREFRHNSGVDDDSVFYYPWQEFPNSGAKMTQDFVQVECSKKSILNLAIIYSYNHALIVKKTPIRKNIENKSDFAITIFQDLVKNVYFWDRPSVLLFGLDSISRSNFIRKLPNTHNFLMKQPGAFNFEGFIKVGDNTNINWIALLTGLRVGSTADFAQEIKDKWYTFYDNWANFVWKQFAAVNYTTLFAEDRPDISNFNYLGRSYGFKQMPTTHYFRPFWLATYWTSLHRRSTSFCYNHIPDHKVQLDYLARFIKQYSQEDYWAFNWLQELSHEVLNPIGVADQDFLNFFSDNWSYFNKTILIIISDHGHRYDSIRESIIGRLEARLPYMTVILPEDLMNQYPWLYRNLRLNSKRLTTPFDVYATMQDVINKKFEIEDNTDHSLSVRGHSLFRPIPTDRGCVDAHVPQEFCPCYQDIPLEKDHPTYMEAAIALTATLNSILLEKANEKCSKLKLSSIVSVSAALPHKSTIKDPQVSYRVPSAGFHINYRIVLKMAEPSKALIEATILKDWTSGLWTLNGDVERNNRYGNTSYCVNDRLLLKICHCI